MDSTLMERWLENPRYIVLEHLYRIGDLVVDDEGNGWTVVDEPEGAYHFLEDKHLYKYKVVA